MPFYLVLTTNSPYLARPTVQARVVGTVVKFPLAVRSCKARRTTARVRTLSSVKASATMPAWFVVCAVVQILVAKKSTPSFITEAVPGLLASPVEATRVPLTFITKAAFPPTVAPANKTRVSDLEGLFETPCLPLLRQSEQEAEVPRSWLERLGSARHFLTIPILSEPG